MIAILFWSLIFILLLVSIFTVYAWYKFTLALIHKFVRIAIAIVS